MNRRKMALALVLGCGALSLAARELLSFQVDSRGVKNLAHAVIARAGHDMEIADEVQKKVSGLADFGIDQAAPVLTSLYQNLSALDAGAPGKEAAARLDELDRSLVSLVDLKDRVVAEAGKTLSPRERAVTIVKVGERFREHLNPTEQEADAMMACFRRARQARIKTALKLDDARATTLFGAMDKYVAQRRASHHERRALFQSLSAAVAANAPDATVVKLLADWDKVTAKMSDVARQQIAEASKLLTIAEKLALIHQAKTRIDRALGTVALIARFAPVAM